MTRFFYLKIRFKTGFVTFRNTSNNVTNVTKCYEMLRMLRNATKPAGWLTLRLPCQKYMSVHEKTCCIRYNNCVAF